MGEPADQGALIDDLVAADEWYLLLLDAARYDMFAERYHDYLEGELRKADNGAIGFTSEWFAAYWTGDYDAICVNPQPIHTFTGGPGYDERQHFALVPSLGEFEWDADLATCPPAAVVDVLEEWWAGGAASQRLMDLGYVDEADAAASATERGLVRFLQPHPPFRQLVELTAPRANRHRVISQAVTAGDVTREAVREAYADNLRWGLEAVAGLVEELPGRVVVTADHGEMLGEDGEWFHRGALARYDEIRHVPWLEVEGVA